MSNKANIIAFSSYVIWHTSTIAWTAWSSEKPLCLLDEAGAGMCVKGASDDPANLRLGDRLSNSRHVYCDIWIWEGWPYAEFDPFAGRSTFAPWSCNAHYGQYAEKQMWRKGSAVIAGRAGRYPIGT